MCFGYLYFQILCAKVYSAVFMLCGILQLQPNSASGSGALEHDPSSIYLRIPAGEAVPGPLPLGVSVIDASVALFGVVFPHVSYKHRSVYISVQFQNLMPCFSGYCYLGDFFCLLVWLVVFVK